MLKEQEKILITDFDYSLPEEKIAKYPLEQRDLSKLLVYQHGQITETKFQCLSSFLPSNALLVFNNTRVIKARMHFQKATGAVIEIFCLEPFSPKDYEQNFASTTACQWLCLIGNAKKWKGEILKKELTLKGITLNLTAELKESIGGSYVVLFSWDNTIEKVSFAEILEALGELPIPPYLNRATEEADLTTYQTVYAKIKGSVAAPTAGLHFTQNVFQSLTAKQIQCDEITLHVGAGTFKPVKTTYVEDHEMHAEWISVTQANLQNLIQNGGTCIAVGTTSVRTLESLYYIGIKLHKNPACSEEDLMVKQWEPYQLDIQQANISTLEALQAILNYLKSKQLEALHTSTQIIIKPGYQFRIVTAMITNFHQPKSTLLLLVSAFLKGRWREVYTYALTHQFRFLSYGDSSLLFCQTN